MQVKWATLKQLMDERIIVLDGAMGTELQKKGMPPGVCPELWAVEHPDVLLDIQQGYVKAGARVIYTATFGANRIKLEHFGLGDMVFKINCQLAKLAKQAAGQHALVAGDISSTGRYIYPLGDLSFEEAVEIYKEQVRGLLEGGVDLFIIETMTDIQEARAALLAVKESCDLPVWVTMTFEEGERTLTGTDPVTALITLQSLGADVVGCNCSTGPDKMVSIIEQMRPYAKVPLLAKPNAGLPKLVNGMTVFDMGPEEFGRYARLLAQSGANLIGGCCGTSAEYVAEIVRNVKDIKPLPPSKHQGSAVTSARKTVFIGAGNPFVVVGERINPTGKPLLQEALKQKSYGYVRQLAVEQVEKGADMLDVNVGMPGIDEPSAMVDVINTLVPAVDAPLCLDSSNIEALERGLRIYPGRALVNSISLEKDKIEKLLPIAAKYGAMFILLPLTDEGVPLTAHERQKVVQEVFERAAMMGYQKEDIVVDGLVMAVSSNQKQAVETLNLIDWCSNSFGCNTIIGLSNVSFGLPERAWLNAAFLAMAMGKGLTMAIVNPLSQTVMNIKMASEVLLGRDLYSQRYIKYFTQAGKEQGNGRIKAKDADSGTGKSVEQKAEKSRTHYHDGAAIDDATVSSDKGIRVDKKAIKQGADHSAVYTAEDVARDTSLGKIEGMGSKRDDVDGVNDVSAKEKAAQRVFDAVVKGDHHGIVSVVESALAQGIAPRTLMDEYLIPAITYVGELFERKEYFLPQLLMSAEAMKKAFEHLEPLLKEEVADAKEKKVKVILATVKGDIHDIGKNIVALMLRNHGFEVIDLGKDVSAEVIIEKAKETGAQIVGLSALMTTTMVQMKEVIALARKEGLKCKFMVGGAAVTQQFADEIGADGYAEDANGAVKLAKKLVEELIR